MQVVHCSKDTKTRADSSLSIVFMRLGIPKVHQEPIAKELGDMSLKTSDDLGADLLICTDNVSILFRIKLGGELRGVHEVTEHHGELAAFGLRRGRDNWCDLDLRRRDVRRGRR